MILINLSIWGGCLGSIAASLWWQKKSSSTLLLPRLTQNNAETGFFITFLVFLVFLALNYFTGTFNSRFEIGSNLSPSTPAYYLAALDVVQPLVFLFAGACLSNPLTKRVSNLFYVAVTLIGGATYSFTGGREPIIQAALFFVIGSMASGIELKKIKQILLFTLPLLLGLFMLVGFARSESNFSQASLSERVEIFYKVATRGAEKTGLIYDNPYYKFFSRVAERSGQKVIDDVVESHEFLGFQSMDRVAFLFIPKFIVRNKVYDDSNARLNQHGILTHQFSAPPITLLADSFERFGCLGVFWISALTCYCLDSISFFIDKFKADSWVKLSLLGSLAFMSFRIYSMSFLRLISLLSYDVIKMLILFYILFYCARNLLRLRLIFKPYVVE
jgi:hypothetical protein